MWLRASFNWPAIIGSRSTPIPAAIGSLARSSRSANDCSDFTCCTSAARLLCSSARRRSLICRSSSRADGTGCAEGTCLGDSGSGAGPLVAGVVWVDGFGCSLFAGGPEIGALREWTTHRLIPKAATPTMNTAIPYVGFISPILYNTARVEPRGWRTAKVLSCGFTG
jgi:hypothetical protein